MTPPAAATNPDVLSGGLLPPEPMDPQITSIQPGGGTVMRLELAWGAVRRAYLRVFWPGYLRRMLALRQGEGDPCPHPVLDPRDLKFYQNQPGYYWRPEDDPFTWRDRIPFARPGLAELLCFSIPLFAAGLGLAWYVSSAAELSQAARTVLWIAADSLLILGALVVWFFRDPEREIPSEAGMVVSPADGLVSSIDEIPHDDYLGGPAVQIGIFLSVFNVHVNRAPVESRVIGLTYRRGRFLNALRSESARENEQLAIRVQELAFPHRRMIVRQIAGAIARRIVCWLKPGDDLSRGERIGMIKFGSRTELVVPREAGLAVRVSVGDRVKGGSTVLAEYRPVSPS